MTDTNVFLQPGNFADPLTEVLREHYWRKLSRLRSRPCSVGTPTRRPMMAASGWCATAICQSARS